MLKISPPPEFHVKAATMWRGTELLSGLSEVVGNIALERGVLKEGIHFAS
jgi:hypothetical protein